MTQRDRILLAVVGVVAIMAGAWFGVLAPKRQESAKLADEVAQAQQQRDTAVAAAAGAETAKAQYAKDYATVARLGKAVPADDDVPSLVYQLEKAAQRSGIDFRLVQLNGSPSAAPATGAGAATTGTLPPGASVGTGGLTTMPFKFTFDGDFTGMRKFFGSLEGFAHLARQGVSVNGRLLTIDGLSITEGRAGFPAVKAQVTATAFLGSQTKLPADAANAAGSAPAASPAGGSQQAGSTPPTATVTGAAR